MLVSKAQRSPPPRVHVYAGLCLCTAMPRDACCSKVGFSKNGKRAGIMAHGYLVPQVTVWPLSVPRKHLWLTNVPDVLVMVWCNRVLVGLFSCTVVQVGSGQDGYHNNRLSHFFGPLPLEWVWNKDSSMQCRLDDVEDAHLPCSSLYSAALLYQVLGCLNICLYWFLLMASLCLPSYNNSNNTSTSGRQCWDEQTAGADISAWKAWTGRLVVIGILASSNLSLAAWRIFIEFKFKGYCLNVFTILNLRNENCKCCFVSSTAASLTLSGKVEDRYSGL